jgi:putative copper resistance protein D
MWIDSISVAIRALSFIALMQAAGAALFIALFGDTLSNSRHAIQRMSFWSAMIGIVLVVLHHSLEAGRMAGEFTGVTNGTLQQLSLHSATAAANTLRLLGLALIALCVSRNGKRWRILGVAGTMIIAAAFVLVGHSSMHQFRWLLAPLLLLHVAIVAFWFGSLLPLYMVAKHEGMAVSGTLIEAFSALAVRTVPVIAIAGLIMAWILLPTVNALLEPYGLLLLTKVMVFAMLMVLAALNKWRFGPAIARGQIIAIIAFQRSVMLEYGLMCCVLAVTAIMTGLFSPEPM